MTLEILPIEPGIGVGPLRYGMKEIETGLVLGEPDKIDVTEYVEGEGDWHRTLWYFSRKLHLTFNQEDAYRLGTITVMGKGFPLFGRDLFGLPARQVSEIIAQSEDRISRFENYTWDEHEPLECLDHAGLGIIFWFKAGRLDEMQCSYLFQSDGDTIIWP